MAIFEKSQQATIYVDRTYPLKATIENTQIIQGHTEYIIKVQNGWSSHSSILTLTTTPLLNNEFKSHHVKLNLPPKKYIGNLSQKFVAERQVALQEYLNSILSDRILSLSAPIRKFLDIPNTSNNIHHFEDTALQHISMVLRSEQNYELGQPLPNLGWRPTKQYYRVAKSRNSASPEEFLVSWVQYGGDRVVPDKHMSHVIQMLLSVQHPYIAPIDVIHSTDIGCVKVQRLATRGSLRDLICSCTAPTKESYLSKYYPSSNVKRASLGREKIIGICLQILHGLRFLHGKGLYHGHLHTGNILVTSNTSIQVSELENLHLGVSPLLRPCLIQARSLCTSMESIDVYCFGVILYELCTGCPLQSVTCDLVSDAIDVDIRALLESILSSKALQSGLPSLQDILSLPLFQGYVPDTNNNLNQTKPRVKMSNQMKKYLPVLYETVLNRLAVDHRHVRHEKRLQRMESLLGADSDLSQYVMERTPSLNKIERTPSLNKIDRPSLERNFSDGSTLEGRLSLNGRPSLERRLSMNDRPGLDRSVGSGRAPVRAPTSLRLATPDESGSDSVTPSSGKQRFTKSD
ncbi:PX domain-containing protein kinase-like protein [Diaphorina citri]|uniref:PX domain-containing protein kinase-like protein n=1 Tax=Diaphorina citri TaxID=121845 RepID=A0A3Q0JBJ9_DIACI|nr:PX domain-containing protein kinase-like protein [Diaphorina citri]